MKGTDMKLDETALAEDANVAREMLFKQHVLFADKPHEALVCLSCSLMTQAIIAMHAAVGDEATARRVLIEAMQPPQSALNQG